MDQLIRDVLNATKEIYSGLSELEIDGATKKSLKARAAAANKSMVGIRKHLADARIREDVQRRIILEAVKDEMIDRDANAARVAEKHRMAAERVCTNGSLDTRAEASVAMINAAIASLCPWQGRISASTPLLAAARTKHDASSAAASKTPKPAPTSGRRSSAHSTAHAN